MVYPALPPLLPLVRTPRLPVFDWIDAPADLSGLVRFAERQNLVSARVPPHLKRSLPVLLRLVWPVEAVLQTTVSRDHIPFLLICLQVFRSCIGDTFPSIQKFRLLGKCKDAFVFLRIANSSNVCVLGVSSDWHLSLRLPVQLPNRASADVSGLWGLLSVQMWTSITCSHFVT